MYDAMNENDGFGVVWRPLNDYGGHYLETEREFLMTEGVIPGIAGRTTGGPTIPPH